MLGLVSGSRIRSSRVETDSTCFGAQVERVEVEAQAPQQRQAKDDGRQGQRRRPNCAACRENGREARARPSRPAPRSPAGLSTASSAGSRVMVVSERDDHAGSGDQSEFGETHIGGRQERVESGRDRGRRKQKRPAPRRAPSLREPRRRSRSANRSARYRTLNWMPKSTPRPMNSTAKATEMRFSAPTIHRPTAAVKLKPDGEIDQDGEDDPGLLERQPQDQENDEDRHDAVQRRAVGDRGEFLIRKGHRAGEAHRDAPVRRQPQFRDRRPDGLRRLRLRAARSP